MKASRTAVARALACPSDTGTDMEEEPAGEEEGMPQEEEAPAEDDGSPPE